MIVKLINILNEMRVNKPKIKGSVNFNLFSNLNNTYPVKTLSDNFEEIINILKKINPQIPSKMLLSHSGIYEDVFSTLWEKQIDQPTLKEFLQEYFTWLYANLYDPEAPEPNEFNTKEQELFVNYILEKRKWLKFENSTFF